MVQVLIGPSWSAPLLLEAIRTAFPVESGLLSRQGTRTGRKLVPLHMVLFLQPIRGNRRLSVGAAMGTLLFYRQTILLPTLLSQGPSRRLVRVVTVLWVPRTRRPPVLARDLGRRFTTMAFVSRVVL